MEFHTAASKLGDILDAVFGDSIHAECSDGALSWEFPVRGFTVLLSRSEGAFIVRVRICGRTKRARWTPPALVDDYIFGHVMVDILARLIGPRDAIHAPAPR